MLHTIKRVVAVVHPDGWSFSVLICFSTLFFALWWKTIVIPGTILVIWCLYFFRDPNRITVDQRGLLISPADGTIQMIQQAPLPRELGIGPSLYTRISIFMNLFNCHINRIPADGTIAQTVHNPGRFLNASLNKASEDNERQTVRLILPDGRNLIFVQIAGLIARRIRCNLREGMVVQAGERFGLIRFGSRVDIYLPNGVLPLVAVGQKTIAGETVLAILYPFIIQ